MTRDISSSPTRPNTQRIFQNGSVTYYYSSLFFTGQVKQDVFTLYAYVRVVDDFVDTPHPQHQTLEHMWQNTLDAWAGTPIKDSIVTDFVELAKRKNFEWEWIAAFWEAMRSDLTKKRYHSFAELERYMYGSAEVIGLMMARTLDLPAQAAQAAALQGKAMQFVNFIRDVQEDHALGRNYLNYSPRQAHNSQQWEALIRKHLDRYHDIQRAAEQGYHFLPRKYRIPIKTAADMYSWTARRIYADPMIVWRHKVKPTKWRVFAQAIKNGLGLT